MVTDPTGTPLNVRRFDGKIIGALRNGEIVKVLRTGADPHGKPWLMSPTRRTAKAGSTASSLAAIDGHAGAGVSAASTFGNGLNVKAIRNAPIPIAQEPT
jgi:hypothetical protein